MGRWEPDARGRLAKAALELYDRHGYEQTTVAEIAEAAGVTERTFFRHYADKREVLFDGSQLLQARMLAAVHDAPAATAPLEVLAGALDAAADVLQERRSFAARRQRVIASHPELRSRELMKLALLSDAIAAGLRERGVPGPAAGLVAETGIGVFKVAFERWLDDPSEPQLGEVMRATLDDLRAVTGTVR
jgi:AcrR family transcriptional regulator